MTAALLLKFVWDVLVKIPLLKGLDAHLVYVGEPTQEIQKEIDWAEEQLQQAGFKPTIIIQQGDVEKTIIDYSDTRQISLLVVGAYGHSRIRQFFIGSSTTKLIARSKKPILLYANEHDKLPDIRRHSDDYS
ncbi:universal stress protein [Oligella ureolytica]